MVFAGHLLRQRADFLGLIAVIASIRLRANSPCKSHVVRNILHREDGFDEIEVGVGIGAQRVESLGVDPTTPALAAAKLTSKALAASSAAVLALAKAARGSITLFSSALRKLC